MTGARQTNRLYVVATWVPRRETIAVGSLGPVVFRRGWYAYVGSARRGRDARVARHMRADKPLRWHADRLFARHPATRAWPVDSRLTECELVDRLVDQLAAERTPPGFGSSDCSCAGHLMRLPHGLGGVSAVLSAGPGRTTRPRTPAGAW